MHVKCFSVEKCIGSMQTVCMDLIKSNKTACIAWAIVELLLLACLTGTIHAAISRHANVSKTSNLIYLLLFAQNAQDVQQLLMAYQNWLLPTVEEQQQRYLPFLQEDAL